MDNCCHCKKPIEQSDKGPRDVHMEYDGLKFKGWKSGFDCSNCVKERMMKGYDLLKKEKIIERLEVNPSDSVFEIVDGVPYYRIMEEGIKIDWVAFDKYLRLMRGYREASDAVEILREIGILSFSSDNNYAIVAGGVFVYLFDKSFHMFFTRVKDAKECAERMYGKAEYPWSVMRVEVIMSSEKGAI